MAIPVILDRIPAGNPKRILVIQTAFLGDIVLATSFLANLRRLHPHAEIKFLTTPVGSSVLQSNSIGVQSVVYDKRGKDRGFAGFVRVAKSLRSLQPDLVFCLHRSLRSALLTRISGGALTFGFHDAVGSLLFDRRIPRPVGVFEAEKNNALLRAWVGEKAEGLSLFPQLGVSPDNNDASSRLLDGLANFVVLVPSSVWATKRWPAEKFGRIAEMLWEKKGLRCVLVGGSEKADIDIAKAILDSVRSSEKKIPLPLDLIGKTNLGILKSLLSKAKLVIANDTAPLHIAIAMGAPVLGIFGPTTKILGFFPLAPEGKSKTAELIGLECRPCGLHGHHVCPLGHFRCMLELSPEAVYLEAEKLLCQ